MAIRQRQMYETAFDSKVKREVEDIDRLAQSPMLQNGEPGLRLRVTPGTTVRSRVGSRGGTGPRRGSPLGLRVRESRESAQPRHLANIPLHFTPTEKRKVTLIRDSPRSLSPQPQRVKVNATVEPLPSSLLNRIRDRRGCLPNGDHSASAPASTSSLNRASSEEDRLSRPRFLSESSQLASSTGDGDSKTFSPTTEFKKLDMVDTLANGRDSDHQLPSSVHDNVTWGNFVHRNANPPKSLGLPLPSPLNAQSVAAGESRSSPDSFGSVPFFFRQVKPGHAQGVASPQQSIPAVGTQTTGKRQPPAVKSSGLPARPNLSLNFNSSPKRARQHLILNFGCAALSVVGEKVDPAVPLEKQGWFHGFISRLEAENVLRLLKEGSYLVRNCENCKHDYLLSVKSAKGFMHMKIVSVDGKFFLGQVSQPFESVPHMVQHYSLNKLPIRGAEHMTLLHPVIDQLL